MFKVLDLFSGIGGFSLGLEATGGFETVAFCEIDPFCRRVLARHWPEVPILDDVRTPEFPAADIIVGGFPCQDVSRAGKRAGVSGERSGLYRELVRAVRLVGPKYAILENVAALLADGMGDVLGDLAEGGACVEWDCVPACALGAPHQRDRVWIVAHADSERRTTGPTDEGSHGTGDDGAWNGQSAPQGWHDVTGWVGRDIGAATADAQGLGRGPRRARRPPDSFAWIRDPSRWNAADTDGERLAQRQGVKANAQSQLSPIERTTFLDVWERGWPCEPALLGVDDGIPDRAHRVRALGNSLLPQIPYLIGRAILEAEGRA